MGQLRPFLGSLACRYLARKTGSVRLGAAPLNGRAQERRRKHLERCAACRVRAQREQQYLERLRGAAVPAASKDLTARLLARTEELAAGPEQALPGTGSAPERKEAPPHQAAPSLTAPSQAAPHQTLPHLASADEAFPPRPGPRPARARPLRLAVQIAGGVAAAAVLMSGATYTLGGQAAPSAEGAFSSDFPGQLTVPALSTETVAGAAWSLSGEPDVAPAGALSSGQLSALRARGWACPELRELGYHLVWARGGVAYGSEVLELRLTDGVHFATVLEQHAAGRPEAGGTAGPGQPDQAAPVNVLTGHQATADGFVAARLGAAGLDGTAQPQDPASAAGALWVNTQPPFRAIYRTPEATFTYISELPAAQADDGVGALVHAGLGPAAAARSDEELPVRLERGLERIAQLVAR
ncbi:MAG: hypothetical protein NTU93_15740 [Arthrobacter sp.]|nr:hypothetical protein [Arthrobacter sp.]